MTYWESLLLRERMERMRLRLKWSAKYGARTIWITGLLRRLRR